MLYRTITPTQLHQRLQSEADALLVIDVREVWEAEIAFIQAAKLLPMSLFREWAGTLDPTCETVVLCHHGVRSAHICQILAQHGFTQLHNLAGGIDRWAYEVDPQMPVY